VTDESSFLEVNRRTWQPSRVTQVMLEDEVLTINQMKGQEMWYARDYIDWIFTGEGGDDS
jgi:hypothetical protein